MRKSRGEAFIAAEVKKLASEEGNDYRDTLAELMTEGIG